MICPWGKYLRCRCQEEGYCPVTISVVPRNVACLAGRLPGGSRSSFFLLLFCNFKTGGQKTGGQMTGGQKTGEQKSCHPTWPT